MAPTTVARVAERVACCTFAISNVLPADEAGEFASDWNRRECVVGEPENVVVPKSTGELCVPVVISAICCPVAMVDVWVAAAGPWGLLNPA